MQADCCDCPLLPEAREEFLPFVCKLGGQALKVKIVSGEGDLAGFCSALCRAEAKTSQQRGED